MFKYCLDLLNTYCRGVYPNHKHKDLYEIEEALNEASNVAYVVGF